MGVNPSPRENFPFPPAAVLLLWDIVDTVLLGNLDISGLRHQQMPGRAGIRHGLCRVSCLRGVGSEGDWSAGRDPTFPKGLTEHGQHLPELSPSAWTAFSVSCQGFPPALRGASQPMQGGCGVCVGGLS